MRKQAVIIFGPPGSGKGTQAELLARKFNFIHFDTGRYIESVLYASDWRKSVVVRRQRKLFDTGQLCTPSWVLQIVRRVVTRIAKVGYGVVFSGSPRTFYEAFGTKNNGLLSVLEKLYGKKSVVVIQLLVGEKSSIQRNNHRLVCSVCGLPFLARAKVKTCAFCGGKMRTRSLDTLEVIKIRLKEYYQRTYPIIAQLKKQGFKIVRLNGEPAPYKVHQQIIKILKLK